MAMEAYVKYLQLFAGALTLAAIALTAPQTTQACTIDGKPTAYADGSRAVLSHVKLTVATARTWAPFSFHSAYHARTAIRLTEDRAQLRGVLQPDDAMQRAWSWEFGDGTHATGWTVTHRYAHPGAYRITVSAYYPTFHQYISFDKVRITITR
jgi:chitodextrinase